MRLMLAENGLSQMGPPLPPGMGSTPLDKATQIINSHPHSVTSSLPLLLVGGTGLYIKSIVQGLKIPRVAPNEKLRSQLSDLGQTQCYLMLQSIDSIGASKIHPNDTVRTIRALEVFYVTGRPISQQQGENPPTILFCKLA